MHELVRHEEAVPSAAELRIEYSSLLGWASGLVAAMFDQLAAARDKLHLMSQASGTRPRQGRIGTAQLSGGGRRADPLAFDTRGPRREPAHPAPRMGARPAAYGRQRAVGTARSAPRGR